MDRLFSASAGVNMLLRRRVGPHFEAGGAQTHGRAHVALEEGGAGLFALLDGHGGEACALLLKRALEERFGLIAEQGLHATFAGVDAALRDLLPPSSLSGSSCVLALAKDGRLELGHVGDSRAILCDPETGAAELLTSSHSPAREDEAARIIAAGQEIRWVRGVARINGGLALSRCFGAFDYKASGAVTAAPECVRSDWPAARILVLYCAAVAEAYADEEAAETAAATWRATRDAAASASAVCEGAIRRGARRGAACLVVARLAALGELRETARGAGDVVLPHAAVVEEHGGVPDGTRA